MKHSGLLLTVLAFILASCGTVPNIDPDWCYTFHFDENNYSATVTAGEYEPFLGFVNTGGTLNAVYTHTGIVEPSVAIVRMYVSTPSDAAISATFNIFGITGSHSDTIPSYITSLELPLTVSAAATYGNSASVNISSSATITVYELEIQGTGSNPFPSNDCPPNPTATNTQRSIPSPTASSTPLPTLTATGTPTTTATPTTTPTPTNTPTATPAYEEWIYYDGYGDLDQSYTLYNIFDGLTNVPIYSSTYDMVLGSSPASTTSTGLRMRWTETRTINYIQVCYDGYKNRLGAIDQQEIWINGVEVANQNIPNTIGTYTACFNWQGSNTTNPDVLIYLFVRSNATAQGGAYTLSDGSYMRLTRMTIRGPYTAPTATPTLTPTQTHTPTETPEETNTPDGGGGGGGTGTPTGPTNTPAPTSSPSYEEQCIFTNPSFNDGLYGWTLSSGLYSAGSVLLADSNEISQTLNLSAGTYYLSARVAGAKTPKDSGVYNMSLLVDINGTPTGSFDSFTLNDLLANGNSLRLSDTVILDGGSTTFDFIADLDSGPTLQINELCLSFVAPGELPQETGDNPTQDSGYSAVWATCGDQISPPSDWLDLGGWISYLWNSLLQWLTCTLLAILQAIVSLVQSIFTFIQEVWTDIQLWLLTLAVNTAIQAAPVLNDIQAAISEVVDFIQSAFALIGSYMTLANGLLNIVLFRIQLIINTWLYAPAVPIPGMPNCDVAPTTQDICAIYYVMEYTILNGAAGWLIIPAAVVIIDVASGIMIFEVVKRFIGYINRTISR